MALVFCRQSLVKAKREERGGVGGGRVSLRPKRPFGDEHSTRVRCDGADGGLPSRSEGRAPP